MTDCNCGRTDDWHLPSCRSLTSAVLAPKYDAPYMVYRNDND